MSSRTRLVALLLTLVLTHALVGPRPATAAILTVTSCADIGPTTLRGQVAAASAGDTILLPACTIALASPVIMAMSLTVSGEGAAVTAISGSGVTQVLAVNGGTVVTISAVTIRGGDGNLGGGVNNAGTLTLLNSAVTGNTNGPNANGGGLFNFGGTLTLLNSAVSGNTSQAGGGLGNIGAATLLNSTVSGNSAGYGGGIFSVGILTLLNSTVSGNHATFSFSAFGGGGINTQGPVALLNSTVSGNTTVSSVGGGGLRNDGGAWP